ncbi:MAG TPA: BatD family protein [Byssovorax sp.]|jgi:hypothetical protein|nr:BatD family protein [Polyangia bacterium]
MRSNRILVGACCAFALGAVVATPALAAPMATHGSPTASASAGATQGPHASLTLEVQKPKAWVGQAVPVTVRAYFRGVEGVTLEGVPALASPGIFTSELAPKPRQATQIIGGAPVLVATWTGTVMPSSAGHLALRAELPVELRYREAAPRARVQTPGGDDEDPFDALARDPFDTSAIDRFFQQSMGQALGRVRAQTVTLEAAAQSLDVEALPTADQPASFGGAIGRFELSASVSAAHAAVGEPITLRVAVQGDGDLDRVELAGAPTSDAWKAYPSKATVAPAEKGKRARKLFEQVLVPLHGGELTVPAVSLTTFDPAAAAYVTRETAPIVVSVDGPQAAAAAAASGVASSATGATAGPEPARSAPIEPPREVSTARVATRVAPAGLLVVAAAILAARRKRRDARALRSRMRKAAAAGDTLPFYRAAHELIEAELARRWGVARDDVRPDLVRARLGPDGEVLAEALAIDEALRFGRGHLGPEDLVPSCSSIERSLGGAS